MPSVCSVSSIVQVAGALISVRGHHFDRAAFASICVRDNLLVCIGVCGSSRVCVGEQVARISTAMVRFSLLELKGEYDFGSSYSEYKGDLFIGNAKVR